MYKRQFAAYAVLILALLGHFGVQTTSFITILGSAGVAIGLSLQGSLSNFAGGILILILKPFVVGDYVSACGCEGTVAVISLFYTTSVSYTHLKAGETPLFCLF